MFKTCFVFMLALSTLPLAISASPVDDFNRNIQTIQKKYSIVGISVVAVQKGEVLGQVHSGWADMDRQVPVTAQTQFRIASISKLVTTTALMQLWEKGKFKLDDDISRHLGYRVVNPRFPQKPITFRHLLTHTSSLLENENYNRFLMLTYEAPTQALDMKALLSEGGSHYHNGASFGDSVPGEKYHYSNLGFGLLGTLVEKLSGEKFHDYCRKHILQPLGMTASFTVWDLPDVQHLAVLYSRNADGWTASADNYKGVRPADRVGPDYPPGRNALVFSPQGGLRVSALDMAKFMRQFMATKSKKGKRVLKKSTIALMQEEQWTNGAQGTDYRGRGVGFHLTQDVVPGEMWVGHSGSAYGLLSNLYFKKAGANGFVMITNGSKPGREVREFAEMEREVIAAVLQFLQEAVTRK